MPGTPAKLVQPVEGEARPESVDDGANEVGVCVPEAAAEAARDLIAASTRTRVSPPMWRVWTRRR
jgi:hypothetical protein